MKARDQELADEVREAADRLNEAICRANDAGIICELRSHMLDCVDGARGPVVEMLVAKRL